MAETITLTEPATRDAELPQQTGHDRVGYLFGLKLKASISPLFHNTIYAEAGLNWNFGLLESTDIPQFLQLMREPKVYGASVTMPNKVTIMPFLDEITPECRDVGACNTIFFRTGEDGQRIICGTNTDVNGVEQSFYRNVVNPEDIFHNRPGLVIGGGGAARSAVYALHKFMRATQIYLVNRDASEVESMIRDCKARGYGDGLVHVQTVEQAQELEAPGAIVACVPDLQPRTAEEKLARSITNSFLEKERKGSMLEMCYNPNPYTELGKIAEEAGWQVILGTEATIYQGLEQDKYWTGIDVKDMPLRKIHEVVAARLAQSSGHRL